MSLYLLEDEAARECANATGCGIGEDENLVHLALRRNTLRCEARRTGRKAPRPNDFMVGVYRQRAMAPPPHLQRYAIGAWVTVIDYADVQELRAAREIVDVRVLRTEVESRWPAAAASGRPAAVATSGAPGRPSSMHLVEIEYRRREQGGLVGNSLKAEAAILAAWLRRSHPAMPPAGAKAIENHLRHEFRGRHPLKLSQAGSF